MSITINISSAAADGLDQFDLTSLSNLSLQYQSNLDRFSANEGDATLTQLSSSQISFRDGSFSFTLAGSGIGPVSTQQALIDAIDAGVATGAFNSLTLREGTTTILSMAFTAAGTTISSGDVSLSLAGNVPNSFQDIFALQGLLQDLPSMTAQNRADLFDDLSAFNATGISLTKAGTQLFGISLTDTTASLTIDGYTFSAQGTIPNDLGAVAETLYTLADLSDSLLYDADLTLYNAAGQQAYSTFYYPEIGLDTLGLSAGTYYAQVTGYLGAQGRYTVSIDNPATNTVRTLTEGTDATAGTNTAYNLGAEGSFTGEINGADTRDWVAFTYTPFQGQSLSVDAGTPDLSSLATFGLTQFALTTPGGAELLNVTSDGDLLADLLQGSSSAGFTVDGQRFDDVTFALEGAGATSDDVMYAFTPGAVFYAGLGGNDTLYSYNGQDLLLGGAGNDVLESVDGNSTLMGGAGNDRLTSGAAADTLYGDNGTDTLIGGGGDDFLFGGSSTADLRDVIYGGDGNDSIDGGYGNDELRGDAGNDTIAGGFGADTVIGGTGNDVLTGSAYGDEITGGAGNDFINGGFGFDRLNGGTGADKFYHMGIRDHGSDWIQDYSAAEGDVLQFGGAASTAASDFLIQRAVTAGAGTAGVAEVFVTQISTGNLLWALVDGAAQTEINIQIGTQVFDLLA